MYICLNMNLFCGENIIWKRIFQPMNYNTKNPSRYNTVSATKKRKVYLKFALNCRKMFSILEATIPATTVGSI